MLNGGAAGTGVSWSMFQGREDRCGNASPPTASQTPSSNAGTQTFYLVSINTRTQTFTHTNAATGECLKRQSSMQMGAEVCNPNPNARGLQS